MKAADDFWLQPSTGLKTRHEPLSEDQIAAKELQLGIRFPTLYRRLMQQQDGGHVRRSSYFNGDRYWELFINGGDLSQWIHVASLADELDQFMTPDTIKQVLETQEYYKPERGVVISYLDGHSLVVLDYGWSQREAISSPAVVIYEQDGNSPLGYVEVLRVADFEQFVDGLVYHGYEAEKFFVGLSTSLSLQAMANAIDQLSGTHLERREDTRYGWFDFEAYYLGRSDQLAAPLQVAITLSPNQHRSGTYLFQNRPEVDFIISLEARNALGHGGPEDLSDVVASLSAKLEENTDCQTEALLCPHPFG